MTLPVQYLRAGYLAALETFDPAALDVDVSDKIFMITGANTGIGKAATMAIAKRGATIHMLCQFADEDARKEIMEASGNKNLYIHVLDLSQTLHVYQFAKQFVESHNALDVLINCAACQPRTRQMTEDGLNVCYAVNTMAPYVLTTTLFPLLHKTGEARVICVSSSGAYYDKGNFSDLQCERMEPYNADVCYRHTKRCVIIMTEMWARMYPGIQFSAMHPGVVNTELLKSVWPVLHDKVNRTPEEGADTLVWLSLAKAATTQTNGQFYFDRQVTHRYLPNMDFTRCTEEEMQVLMDSLEKKAAEIKEKNA
ncbi:dehydrogenase/reductase SDR family member 12-like [Acanthaster planci]|uniref:Dehydrogenase/reductase SDR family member 12-like n=1 Tax=Acanthaster planci TaxID=133434 RepID=A0A8B7Z7A7_ACAPL|nr:dehydrogenase/reductase SDR family member 12-like [Acanthaster planci]